MRDKDFVELSAWKEFRYYQETRPPVLSDYKHRSKEDLCKDVTVAHDFIKKLIAEKDVMRGQLIATQQDFKKWKRWMAAAFAATWVGFGIAAKVLVPYAVKGFLVR